MAMDKGGTPPAALEPKVVKKLLDLLSTDDDFRDLFKKDAHAALVQAGYTPPSDSSLKSSLLESSAQSGGSCLQLDQDATLASKENIISERAKLESVLAGRFDFLCPMDLQMN